MCHNSCLHKNKSHISPLILLLSDTADLKSKFVSFAKFGDKSADGTTIKLTQVWVDSLASDWSSGQVIVISRFS